MLMAKSKVSTIASPTHEIVTITPAMASAWLADSKFDNRRLDDRNVDKLVRDIKNDQWILDGNPIRFDKENDVLDGQHRLWAIVMAGKPVQSLVIRGLDKETKFTIDAGKPRSNADFFHFKGYTNNTLMAAVCRMSIGHRSCKGDMWKWAMGVSHLRMTASELLAEADNNPAIRIAVQNTIHLKIARKLLGGAIVAFCYYIFSQASKNPAVVDKFWQDFEKGTNLLPDSPILALRNVFTIRDVDFKDKQGGNKTGAYKIALITKAWNAWKDNTKIQKFKYNVEKDAYPIPK